MKEELALDEFFAFEELVMKSVAKRYRENLVRYEDLRGKQADTYAPDEPKEEKGDIWDLLVDLWGEHITLDELERIRENLIESGLEREYWPLAYCEEEEEERPLSDYRTEADEAADYFEAVKRGETAAKV
jgi:hypothetical protein